jgi:excisionase family DNA binding protein
MDTTRALLKPDEVAVELRISRAKVYELLASGELPSIKVGSSIRVPSALLRTWIEDRLVASRDPEAA